MNINVSKLEELIVKKHGEAKKNKPIVTLVSLERHDAISRLSKKYKLTQGEIINLMLDDYLGKE